MRAGCDDRPIPEVRAAIDQCVASFGGAAQEPINLGFVKTMTIGVSWNPIIVVTRIVKPGVLAERSADQIPIATAYLADSVSYFSINRRYVL
jgi:hypothetical protein